MQSQYSPAHISSHSGRHTIHIDIPSGCMPRKQKSWDLWVVIGELGDWAGGVVQLTSSDLRIAHPLTLRDVWVHVRPDKDGQQIAAAGLGFCAPVGGLVLLHELVSHGEQLLPCLLELITAGEVLGGA